MSLCWLAIAFSRSRLPRSLTRPMIPTRQTKALTRYCSAARRRENLTKVPRRPLFLLYLLSLLLVPLGTDRLETLSGPSVCVLQRARRAGKRLCEGRERGTRKKGRTRANGDERARRREGRGRTSRREETQVGRRRAGCATARGTVGSSTSLRAVQALEVASEGRRVLCCFEQGQARTSAREGRGRGGTHCWGCSTRASCRPGRRSRPCTCG